MRVAALSQGETSGVLDQAARAVSEQGLFFLDRTKAAIASYLAGVFKGVIPTYYSYYREDPNKVTVQDVVAFLVKAVKDGDWLKIQATMDELERQALARTVPQYILWPSLATPDQLRDLKTELAQYFELDQGASGSKNVIASVLGIDTAKFKQYLTYAAWGAGILIAGPFVFDLLRALIPKKQGR